MAQIGNTSLFDYLKRPAGAELGTAVYQAARRARSPIGIREVSTKRYTGKVILYTKEFLDEYFKASYNLQSTKNTNMNEVKSNSISYSDLISTGTVTLSNSGYSGTSITTIANGSGTALLGPSGAQGAPGINGISLSGNSTINYSTNQFQNNMRPTQVKVAVFTITRDEDTNEINSSKFLKELWVEQKNGVSIDLIVAKQLDKDFDPEFTVIKVLSTVSF